MLNSLLYFSTDCKNERPFGNNVNISGTFAVILKSAINEIEKEKGIRFFLKKKDRFCDDLYVVSNKKTVKICTIDGNSSVYKIRKAIHKKIK